MRVGFLTDHRAVAVTDDDRAVDITGVLENREQSDRPIQSAMLGAVLEKVGVIRQLIADPATPRVPLAEVNLTAPSPGPRTVFAAPVNFRAHAGELGDRSPQLHTLDARQLGLISLAPASITGPDGAIELPNLPDREFHFEGEIAVVIGKEARGLSEAEAMHAVLGYTGLIDVTMRISDQHREDRSMRKSFHTFTPIGPLVVLADDVGDPAALTLELAVNGKHRQHGELSDLIVSVSQLVAAASHVLPLLPGDVIATGTPVGVGPIVTGDTVTLTVSRVGTLEMPVVQRAW